MPLHPRDIPFDDDRLLKTLQQLVLLPAVEFRRTLDDASTLIADAMSAEKVDVFLYEAERDSLVALGTSVTPLGRKQHALGLDRFRRSEAGPFTRVFETGEPYRTGHADQDPSQPRGVVEDLGIRSQITVALEVNGERRGVLGVTSVKPEYFTERDQRFLEAVAAWIGVLVHRAELVDQVRRDAARGARREAGEQVARLTRRQQEVATLVAEGLSNEEIAERLTLVPGTVANHMESILRRLGLRNRSMLAVWAVEHGLYQFQLEDGP